VFYYFEIPLTVSALEGSLPGSPGSVKEVKLPENSSDSQNDPSAKTNRSSGRKKTHQLETTSIPYAAQAYNVAFFK